MSTPRRRSHRRLKHVGEMTPKQLMASLVRSDEFKKIALAMPKPKSHKSRSQGGRVAEYPPAVFLAIGVLSVSAGGTRAAVRALADMWDSLRKPLDEIDPGHVGLKRHSGPPSRDQYVRYDTTYLRDEDNYAALHEVAVEKFTQAATGIGYFAKTGTTADPNVSDMAFGDGCVFKARMGLERKGLKHLEKGKWGDPTTGEITKRPWDPDAGVFTQGDNTRPYGLKYSIIGAYNGHPGERIILNFGQLGVVGNDNTQDHSEAAKSVQLLTEVQRHAPGVAGLVYDRALQGRHHTALYQQGMFGVSKVHRTKDKLPKSAVLGPHDLKRDGNVVGTVDVVAFDGAPYLYATAAGKRHLVALETTKATKCKNRSTGYRWYRTCKVPCDPRIPVALHGSEFRLRYDNTNEDYKRGFNRAENLRFHPEGTDPFERLIKLRAPSESLNALIKNHLVPHRRAPAIGHSGMRVHLLYQTLYHNHRATIAHGLRHGKQPLIT